MSRSCRRSSKTAWGGGAIGVPVIGMIGGWAIARRGKRLSRAVAGALFVAGLVVWALTATAVGGPTFALDTAHGLWLTCLYYTLLVTLAVAASVPHQPPYRWNCRSTPAVTRCPQGEG
jgi:hypothetical protein